VRKRGDVDIRWIDGIS